MKKSISILFFQALFFCGLMQGQIIITGVVDGPLPGGLPKLVECYAVSNISDLSSYQMQLFSNGGTSASSTYTFPADTYNAGDFFYLSNNSTAEVMAYFGFASDYQWGGLSANGDDALAILQNSVRIDEFGLIGQDGSGTCWEYQDGWAYRDNASSAPTTAFDCSNWSFSGPDALDPCTTNASCGSMFPVGTFAPASACMGTPTAGMITAPSLVCPNIDFDMEIVGQTADAGIEYQWQYSVDGIAWADILGATSGLLTTSITADSFYRAIVTCSASSLSDTTAMVSVTVNTTLCECGCPSGAINTNSSKIDTLELAGMVFASHPDSCETYTLHSSSRVTMLKGMQYNLKVKDGSCSGSFFPGNVLVLADWDGNGAFDQSMDTVLSMASIDTTFGSFPDTFFTVPMGALDGSTLFRVVYRGQTAAAPACGFFPWGETEDFCITVETPDLTCDEPLSGIKALVLDSTRAAIAWDANPDAGFFKIQYRVKGTSAWTLINVPNRDYQRVAWIINGLTPNTVYEYRARQQCPDLTVGPYSSIMEFTTFTMSNCEIPADSKIVYTADPTKVRFYIDYEPSADRYDVRWRVQGTTQPIDNKIFKNGTTVLAGLSPSTDYEYRVRTNCSGVWTGYSAWMPFTTNDVPVAPRTDLENRYVEASENAFTVFPNPTDAELMVQFEGENLPVFVRVFNATGALVSQITPTDQIQRLDVSDFSNGTYFIQAVFEDSKVTVRPFVKM